MKMNETNPNFVKRVSELREALTSVLDDACKKLGGGRNRHLEDAARTVVAVALVNATRARAKARR